MSIPAEPGRAAWRDALLFALPALVVGLALRALLCRHLPLGLVYQDTFDFLYTADRWLADGHLVIPGKKTFLLPLFYLAACLGPLPVLAVIPVIQHFLGLVLIYLLALLCRLWFQSWRALIVPVTLVTALNPHIIWFEHVLMAESIYLVTVVGVAAAGTLYYLRPTWWRLAALLGALALVGGTRPEGKLFLVFGLLLLPAAHRRQPARLAARVAVFAAAAVALLAATRTSQAGLLVLNTGLGLIPGELRCAPGLVPYLAPAREEFSGRRSGPPVYPSVRERKLVERGVRQYMADRRGVAPDELPRAEVQALCARAGKEIMLRNLPALPGFVIGKFRSMLDGAPSFATTPAFVIDRPLAAMAGDAQVVAQVAGRLFPRDFAGGGDAAAAAAYYARRQGPAGVAWFAAWQEAWHAGVLQFRLPDTVYGDGGRVNGLPFYYLLAAGGFGALMVAPGRLRGCHCAWGIVLGTILFSIILIASPRPRFAVLFEPFYPLYAAAAVDLAVVAAGWCKGKLPWARR